MVTGDPGRVDPGERETVMTTDDPPRHPLLDMLCAWDDEPGYVWDAPFPTLYVARDQPLFGVALLPVVVTEDEWLRAGTVGTLLRFLALSTILQPDATIRKLLDGPPGIRDTGRFVGLALRCEAWVTLVDVDGLVHGVATSRTDGRRHEDTVTWDEYRAAAACAGLTAQADTIQALGIITTGIADYETRCEP